VTGLELYSNRLRGTIPSSFGALTALTTLLLLNNTLDDGAMPCASFLNQSFTDLVAERDKAKCSCCTRCGLTGGFNGKESYDKYDQ
jgi:hypothetical protein